LFYHRKTEAAEQGRNYESQTKTEKANEQKPDTSQPFPIFFQKEYEKNHSADDPGNRE